MAARSRLGGAERDTEVADDPRPEEKGHERAHRGQAGVEYRVADLFGPRDGGLDATSGDPLADTLTCTGVEPVCIQSYCNDVKRLDVDYSPICTAEGWKCRAGQMPMSECRCGLPPRRDCLFPDAGADASLDAGDADASQADASADATID